MHIFIIFMSAFPFDDDILPFYDFVMFAVIPLKDCGIALLLARLYYYQGTSEKRCDKDHL